MDASSELESLRDRIVDDTDVPEIVRSFLKDGAELQEIRLDRHGNWWHEGDIFENERLSMLFHQSLHPTSKGNWVLKIKPYTYPVLVDLCGTFVTRILDTEGSTATVRLQTDDTSTIDLEALYTDGDRMLATTVDGMPARIIDTAYRQLTGTLDETDGQFTVAVDDQRHTLRPLPDDFFAANADGGS